MTAARFRDLPIRQKLTWIMMITSTLALLLATVAFVLYDRSRIQVSRARNLSSLAEVVGQNSIAALAFEDRQAAQEILEALSSQQDIVYASIYSKDGQIFAQYTRSGTALGILPSPKIGEEQSYFTDDYLVLYRPIVLEKEIAGGVYLISDLLELRSTLRRQAAIAAIILVFAVGMTFLLASRLQRLISEPILELARAAKTVSTERDYSIRVAKQSEDELGVLMDGFNEMLSQIQERDEKLQRHGARLEEEVAARTTELQASEERFRSLTACSPSGILQTDAAGLCTYTNKRWVEITGLSWEESRDGGWKQAIHADDLKPLLQDMAAAAQEEGEFSREIRLRLKNEEARWIRFSGKALVSEKGEFVGFVGTTRDITARIQAEQALVRAKEAAEAASTAKSEFLANMSHEIRTPMNAIVGMTDLALDTELTREQREYLTTVKTSTDSLLGIINDVLDFSKIEAGKLEMDAIEFSLRETVEETMKTLALRAHEKGLELACRIPPEMPEVLVGDPDRLRQVLTNLVGNAIKFTAKGEVVLELETESQTEQEIGLHFTVRDTGIGIAAAKLQVIFEAFTQADSSTTREYGGTGLGLAIASRLVSLMGGRIWAESEPGRGSVFHFTARFGAAAGPVKKAAPMPAVHLIDLPVLVVDDNKTNRRILEEMLGKWGMRATAVDSGLLALDALQKAQLAGNPYPLVLLDVHMPGMDGFEVAERIHHNQNLSGATIMMLTSATRPGDIARCKDFGVAAYLIKPVRRGELLEALLSVLGKRPRETSAVRISTRRSPNERRRGIRILLAEDNLVNQTVALRLLEKQGHRVVVAGNGREALLALEKAPLDGFDLILMDVQMPEMDGFEATAEIRRREQETGIRHPIVATTAHAMKGDRERCLAAGMDAYIPKPIRAPELLELIEQLVGVPVEKEASGPPIPLPAALPDRKAILELFDGEVELFREVSEIFLGDCPQQLAAVRTAVEQGDAVALERSAHALKGSIGSFAAPAAFQAAHKLEKMGRAQDLASAAEAFAQLEEEVRRLLPVLSALRTEIKTECVS